MSPSLVLLVSLAVCIHLGASQLMVTRQPKITAPPIARNTTVCYAAVGCFNNFPPFSNAGGELPDPPELVGVVFLLYTRKGPSEGEQLLWNDDGMSLQNSQYNHLWATKFIIHGFTQNEKAQWLHQMKDALLALGDMNVVIVGWGPGAAEPNYPRAVSNTRVVAKEIQLLIELMRSDQSDYSSFHLIGHSLGAHIASYVGLGLKGQLGRISGLDPAGPLFAGDSTIVRLDPTDALFVDVIHANAAPLVDGGAGISTPCGHVDFYPNGGSSQPGCPGLISGSWSALWHWKAGDIGSIASCSHDRSYYLYIESIRSQDCNFLAVPCENWDTFLKGSCRSCGEHGCTELGFHSIEFAARGNHYLVTKASPKAYALEDSEFCGSLYYITISPTPGQSNIKGVIDVKITGAAGFINARFQGDGDNLVPMAKIVIVDKTELGQPTGVQLVYKQHEGFFGLGAGVKQWSLDYMLVAHNIEPDTKFCGQKALMVTSGEPLDIPLCQ